MNWARYLLQSVIGLAFVAFVVVLGYTNHLSDNATYTMYMGLVAALGASGIWTLASSKPNADAIPHLVVGLGLLAGLFLLGLHNVFTETEVQAAFALILLGSTTTAAYTAGSNTPTPPQAVPSLPPTVPPASLG